MLNYSVAELRLIFNLLPHPSGGVVQSDTAMGF